MAFVLRYLTPSDSGGGGPLKCRSSTESKSGMSVRSVARSRKRNARSRSRIERRRQRAGVCGVHAPLTRIGGNRFEVPVLGQHRRRGFGAPAAQAWKPIGRIADERQVVGDRRGRHAELRDDAGFVADGARAAIHLHDPRAAHRLREILVGRADQHPIDARVRGRRHRRRRQRVVGLVLDHRPHRDARGPQCVFEQVETARADRARCRHSSCSRARGRCGTTR